jgi:hypothetical protein
LAGDAYKSYKNLTAHVNKLPYTELAASGFFQAHIQGVQVDFKTEVMVV